MKILVPIKRVPDPATTIRVLPDGSGIATDNVKWVINPFCEIAIEEALRIKEKQTGEVILISVGQTTWQEQLRTGLAMGADRAILVKTDAALDQLAIARIIAKVASDEKPDLIILGKQAIDERALGIALERLRQSGLLLTLGIESEMNLTGSGAIEW